MRRLKQLEWCCAIILMYEIDQCTAFGPCSVRGIPAPSLLVFGGQKRNKTKMRNRDPRPLCQHPTIVEARDVFLSAVVPPVSALSSLRYADFWALSSTGRVLSQCWYVAICVGVCRKCHQSGGTDVVDVPDVLLPEDYCIKICLIWSPMFLVIVLMMNWLKYSR